jgi:hypothetical protein
MLAAIGAANIPFPALAITVQHAIADGLERPPRTI